MKSDVIFRTRFGHRVCLMWWLWGLQKTPLFMLPSVPFIFTYMCTGEVAKISSPFGPWPQLNLDVGEIKAFPF